MTTTTTRSLLRLAFAASLASLAASATACGPGGAARGVRPDAPRGSDALGAENCSLPGEEGEPLVVDWKPEHRADLEVAMKDGVAVVAYDCNDVKLLKSCSAPGSYGYTGVTLQEEVLRLEDADEVSANLSGGPSLGAKLKGEFERGTTLDIAYLLVGKQRTTVKVLSKGDLKGSCKGATHFVRGANVGAFAMQTGTKAKVATAGEMFGVGASAKSASSKVQATRAGDLADCKKASPDDPTPPGKCGAAIRLWLVGLAEGTPKRDIDHEAHGASCAKGMVRSGGKCVSASKDVPHLCTFGDVGDCTKQCERGDTGSCASLGVMFEKGRGVTRDDKKAADAYKKACDKGDQRGCSGLGVMLMLGQLGDPDAAAAMKLFTPACEKGDGRGCNGLGRIHGQGRGGQPKKPELAARYYDKACRLGNAYGCKHLGTAYSKGIGVPQDDKKAFEAFTRSCEGDDADGCLRMAFLMRTGKGTTKDEARASAMAKAALEGIKVRCEAHDSEACEVLAEQHKNGWSGLKKDPATAAKYYELACNGGQGDSCADLAELYTKGEGVQKDAKKAGDLKARACKLDHEPSCPAGKAPTQAPSSSPSSKPSGGGFMNIKKKK